jgi:hypothetical protein
MFSDPTGQTCDGLSLIWRMYQHVEPAKIPHQRTVVHLVLTGIGGAEGWLDIDAGGMTVCKDTKTATTRWTLRRPRMVSAIRPASPALERRRGGVDRGSAAR